MNQQVNYSNQLNDRAIWPDLLCIVASFSVIILHSSAVGFDVYAPQTLSFQVCNFYDCITRYAVPVFVMISGMFLLDAKRDYSIRKLYEKKIIRIVVAYLFWSAFYSLIAQIHSYPSLSLHTFLARILWGKFHLWFLFMIVGLYVSTPILRVISRDERVVKYFILLGFLSIFCVNCVSIIPKMKNLLVITTVDRLDLRIVSGFSTYFVLGSWLSTHELSSRIKNFIYALGIFSVVFTTLFNGLFSAYNGIAKEYFSEQPLA